MKKHVYLTFLLLFAYSVSAWTQGQNPAGPDRSMCKDGVTIIGAPSTCSECCYKWSPETGLNDPNLPNPTVLGLSVSMTYAVTISYPDGNYVTDDVNVTVYDAEIQVWHPDYHLPNTMLDPSQVKVPGVQSFVNLDNDDCDLDFDLDDTEVTGGDNEFIKLRILFSVQLLQRPGKTPKGANKGPGEYKAALSLAYNTAVSGLRFWKSNDKMSGEYLLGNELVLTEVSGSLNQYETYLWVEGTEGHTQQQQVKLFAHAFEDSAPACMDKYVGITIIDIAGMEWVGVQNGFTGDGKNDSNTLDPCPHPANVGTVSYQRIFPEKKAPGASSPVRSGAILRVRFSTAPVVSQMLYLRAFDVDDPSAETQFVDPNDLGAAGTYAGAPTTGAHPTYTANEDNRGGPRVMGTNTWTTNKGGVFSGNGISEVSSGFNIYRKASGTGTSLDINHFWVSQKCGDNYRVATSNDQIFLNKLRNFDQYDQVDIVDACTSTPTGACTAIKSNLMSPILTVWRTLHIEYDLMNNPNWADNGIVTGTFSDFDGTDFTQLKKFLKIRSNAPASSTPPVFDPLQPLKDASPHGRFRNGGVRICIPPLVVTNPIKATAIIPGGTVLVAPHGPDDIPLDIAFDATFGGTLGATIKSSGFPDVSTTISNIEKIPGQPNTFKVTLSNPISNFYDYNAGSISIGGGVFTPAGFVQIGSSSNNSLVLLPDGSGVSNLSIPIEIRDNDAIPLGGNSNIIVRDNLDQTRDLYKVVYLDVQNDGGGILTNNTDNIDFSKNISTPVGLSGIDDVYSGSKHIQLYVISNDYFGSKASASDSYWVGHIVGAWQADTYVDYDGDKTAIMGRAAANTNDCILLKGGYGFCIFYESQTERLSGCKNISTTTAHELGHCFGLSHGDKSVDNVVNPCLNISSLDQMGIMTMGSLSPPCSDYLKIIAYHQNIIRVRTKSIGNE
jgi:hypothetical protein